jgi:hypothetical protein
MPGGSAGGHRFQKGNGVWLQMIIVEFMILQL